MGVPYLINPVEKMKKPSPGISRPDRLSETGLRRLEKQLQTGAGISDQVLTQWINKYGEPARKIINKYGRLTNTDIKEIGDIWELDSFVTDPF